jgi:hypothetical protein
MIAKPSIVLSTKDAAMLRLDAGDLAEVSFGGVHLVITVVVDPDLPSGIAGYPFGPLFPFAVNSPTYCVITKRPRS